MFHSINLFEFLLILSIVTTAVISAEYEEDPKCSSAEVVCNNIELAKTCGSYDWCKSQSDACGSINRIERGAKPLFGPVVTSMRALCDGFYTPFKQLYGQPDILSMKLDLQAGRLPFTLNFSFGGYPNSTSPDARLKIRLNDKEIYNNLD